MSKVFVIQNQHKMNRETGELEPKWDLSSAKEFGELVFLLSPTARPFMSDHVVNALHEKLRWYAPGDHLLLIGNPALIGFAVAIAAQVNEGHVRVLQWDGKAKKYISIFANLSAVQPE